jgi:DNA-binding NtrC family response regulator
LTARVILEVPGEPQRALEVAEGSHVLVGRDPGVTGVTVPVPSVSAQHVSLARAGGALTVVDEGSRNGTWLRLPPGDPVVVQSEQPVTLRLGSGGMGGLAADRPGDAEWSGREDFHLGVVAAVTAWFQRLQVAVRVTSLPSPARPGHELPGQIPLANGHDLFVVPARTMDDRWERMAATLWSYAAAQNAIFCTEEHTRAEGMVLVSPAIRRVHRAVVEAARNGIRILLWGPSGAGKDGLARCYHRNSGRWGPFVTKNCSMFTREFLRMELFGAEKGAYTGATRTVIGAVESAQGGTLFLDEIGELPPEVQAMLLTFLDRGEYERFGGNGQLRTADVRILSATNRDLRAAAQSRVFREDLWYRIAEQVIEVPSLAARPEDGVAFLRVSRLPGGVSVHDALAPAALERVLAHRWPGNFRELKSFVAQVPHDAAPGSISADACAAILRRVSLAPPTASPPPAPVDVAARGGDLDAARLARLAAEAFRADLGHDLARWDDVKQYVESYLKPLLFAALSGVGAGGAENADIAALAHAIDADRGTVRKHLMRYLDRFAAADPDDR